MKKIAFLILFSGLFATATINAGNFITELENSIDRAIKGVWLSTCYIFKMAQ